MVLQFTVKGTFCQLKEFLKPHTVEFYPSDRPPISQSKVVNLPGTDYLKEEIVGIDFHNDSVY